MRLPITPGHEIIGIVEKLGPSAKGHKVGDKVAVYPSMGCGDCSHCEDGSPMCNFVNVRSFLFFFGPSILTINQLINENK